nr:retrovirus-related Pol polyprotein from transposon TNT 1-94 [Tanacetum cinerariifolium]
MEFPLPIIKFPLPEKVPTASEESSHSQKKRDATAEKIALLLKSSSNCQSKSYDSYANKYKTAQELWVAILKTFDGNEATKKTKKNLLKQQYGNFKEDGSETLEQTFNRLLDPEWLMHMIVWRNKSDLDTMSLDGLYNHLKVYESEVQKKLESNSHNIAFISLAKHNSGNEEVNIASVSTASTNVSTTSANIGIDKDDMEEMDIKWNMALLSMRADRFWKKTGKKISIQGTYVAGFDKSKAPKALMAIDGVGWDWSYMANDEENHTLVADEEAPTEFALMAKTSAESEVFNNSLCSKACKKNTDSLNSKITDLDDKLCDAKNMIYHYKLGLSQVDARLAEHRNQEVKYCKKIRVFEFKVESRANCIKSLTKDLKLLKKEKGELETKLTGFQTASKDLDSLRESQRLDKNKEGLGYNAVPPPPAQVYSPPKKDMSWTGLHEYEDDTVTDYSRPSLAIESTSDDVQNKNTFVTKTEPSPSTISPKLFIKFVKASDSPNKSKTDKVETAKKPVVKYAEQYRKSTKKPNVRGNQRNWNNLKIHQLGANFVMKKKACFNYGDFDHLAYDCLRSQSRAPWVPTINRNFTIVNRKLPTASIKFFTSSIKFSTADMGKKGNVVKASASLNNIDDKGYWDSGCSRHMTGNISYLSNYEPFDRGYVSFGQGGCKITGKGTIKTGKLEFENVYFVKDLKYNLFIVSQIRDNKNIVLFTDLECIVLGRNFKLLDDTNVFLRTPRRHNMYSIDLNNIVPHKDLTCLVAKSSADECKLWHRRLGHLNFKTMNRLFRHNLVRGLPSKCFENDHNCTVCLKGKQNKASCKSKLVNSMTKPLHTLHMDLFGPTSDETSGILRKFITEIENLKDLKVKIIRCDNGGEFRNKEMDDFCSQKGIKREFSNARTPQQNGVAKRRNRALIEAAGTMLADAKLLVTFWAESVNTTCYVQNRVLVNKSHNKTLYEIFNGRTPAIGFFKPFGCHVMILNTLDHLGKFEAKGDEGFFIGYSMSSKAFKVFNKRTKRVEENLHVDFLENKAIEKGTKDSAGQEVKKDVSSLRYISLPNWVHDALLESSSSNAQDSCKANAPESSRNPNPTATSTNLLADQLETLTVESPIPTVSSPVPTACLNDSPKPSSDTRLISKRVTNQEESPSLDNILTLTNGFEDIIGFSTNSDESNGVEADVEAMQKELLQFKIQNVWTFVDCPKGVRPIGTKWVLKNKKDERGMVIKNKGRLVAQGYTQEEGIDYDEVFAPIARIEAIRLCLAYASFMGFTV